MSLECDESVEPALSYIFSSIQKNCFNESTNNQLPVLNDISTNDISKIILNEKKYPTESQIDIENNLNNSNTNINDYNPESTKNTKISVFNNGLQVSDEKIYEYSKKIENFYKKKSYYFMKNNENRDSPFFHFPKATSRRSFPCDLLKALCELLRTIEFSWILNFEKTSRYGDLDIISSLIKYKKKKKKLT